MDSVPRCGWHSLICCIDVLPLVYNALESEHAIVCVVVILLCRLLTTVFFEVQERALKAVPDLCESIDYAEVQSVLFPRVAVSVLITLVEPFLNQTGLLSWYLQRLAF